MSKTVGLAGKEQTMKNNRKLVTRAIGLILSMGMLGSQLLAQQKAEGMVGKAGQLHIGSTVRAGDVLLKPGTYQVQHFFDGADGIIFTEMKMPGPFEKGRTMNDSIRTEVARVKCKAEPIDRKWRNTRVILRTNAAGGKEVSEVQIKGEKVRHLVVTVETSFSSAQQDQDTRTGRTGKFHTSTVIVDNILLEQGMYQVQHVTEGENHLLVFRVIDMGYRNNMGNQRLGKVVARVKCTTEPSGKKWKDTKLVWVRIANGQKVVTAVQIAGENVLHKI